MSTNSYLRAALLGAISGIRSMSGPATVSLDASRNGRDLQSTPFSMLASTGVSRLVGLAAVGEMVLDKMPFLPNRTDPLPLLGRMLLGGAAGAVAFTEEDQPPAIGAAVSAGAAIISTNLSFRLRSALSKRMPGPVAGLVGDGIVIALASTFLHLQPSE